MSFLNVIYILNIFVALVIIFVERKRPSATMAWIMILYLLPVAGIVFYIISSQVLARLRLHNMSSYMQMKDNPNLVDQKKRMSDGTFEFGNAGTASRAELIRFNQEYAGAFLTQDNDIKIFADGKAAFESMFEDIKNAKSYINMQFFIMKPDHVGLGILDALAEKARQGVKVRLLLDAMGCRKMRWKYFEELKNAGGEVVFFFPARIFKLELKLNYRNHRKLTVIDGDIAYIGGLNAASEYIGETERFGGWRDTHLRVRGGSVYDMDARFIMDWNFASGQEVGLKESDYGRNAGKSAVQIVSSGPERPEAEIKLAYLKMINSAKRSICIQSPYMVPDDSIFDAIKTAALTGLDVRIMVPNKPDHPFVYWVTYQNVGELAKYGVKIYIYQKGFLHAKALVVDDEAASVGSANFDNRSFELSFECNALIYDSDVAKELREVFDRDVKDSKLLTREDYEKRSRWIRIKESVSRLVSDIL